MNVNEHRHTYTHERTCMGTDADVRARTRTHKDGRGRTKTDADVLWDLSGQMRMYVNKRTQALGGCTGARASKTRGMRSAKQ